jgi:hypothetical protein
LGEKRVVLQFCEIFWIFIMGRKISIHGERLLCCRWGNGRLKNFFVNQLRAAEWPPDNHPHQKMTNKNKKKNNIISRSRNWWLCCKFNGIQ